LVFGIPATGLRQMRSIYPNPVSHTPYKKPIEGENNTNFPVFWTHSKLNAVTDTLNTLGSFPVANTLWTSFAQVSSNRSHL